MSSRHVGAVQVLVGHAFEIGGRGRVQPLQIDAIAVRIVVNRQKIPEFARLALYGLIAKDEIALQVDAGAFELLGRGRPPLRMHAVENPGQPGVVVGVDRVANSDSRVRFATVLDSHDYPKMPDR